MAKDKVRIIDQLKAKVLKEIRDESDRNVQERVEQSTEQSRVSLLNELKAYVDDRIAELLLGVEPEPEPTPVEPEPVVEEEPVDKEPKPEKSQHVIKTKHR